MTRIDVRLRALALLASVVPAYARAQTDYYDTDAGRPVRIEDASAIPRRAFELQAAPLRLERAAHGVYRWGLEPEIAYGVLPRTQLEIGAPLVYVDARPGRHLAGLAGVDVSLLHALNVETRLPALAVRADVLLPAGPLGPDRARPSVTGLLTRTFRAVRVHANAQVTLGSASDDRTDATVETSRWLAGAAVDHTFPLRSMLVTGEVYARRPLRDGAPVEWNAGVGSRYQLTPRWAVDGGLARRLTGGRTGDDRAWMLTAGGAFAFGLPWRP
ncbi:MAG: hypothetical protein JO180_10460 [Gemmatirosa sp.]|nr:hypothetical protein [Gemmatirosa sp.]